MSIQFSGLGSGLPINEWVEKLVNAKKESIKPMETKKTTLENSSSALSTIKTSFTSLQTALKTFTSAVYGSSNDPWSKTSVSSTYKDYVTATGSNALSSGNVKVNVHQLATETVAKSASSPAKIIAGDTKFKSLGNQAAKEGTFSVYVNNKRFEIEIGEQDTLDDISTKIQDATGGLAKGKINADGTYEITSTTGGALSLGASSDTSNFKSIMKLTDVQGDSIKSAYSLSSVNTAESLTSDSAGYAQSITKGAIKINGVEFQIDENTTLDSLIRSINQSKDAGVNASYDTLTNKLVLTSKETGEFNISLEDAEDANGNKTNFFEVMGLVNPDGSLVDGTQTMGQNAVVSINGNKIVSSSNTLTSETTGIKGLTINALKVTDGDEKTDEGVKLTVKTDNSDVTKAAKTFVDAYNTVVSQIQEATKKNGYLEMDSSLRNIYMELRSITNTTMDTGGEFKMLSQIGISTGDAGLDVSDSAITLKFDEKKFTEALEKDPDAVKKLFSQGVGSTQDGLMDKMLTKVDSALDPEYGYFFARGESLTKQISNQGNRITKAYEDLDIYQARLQKQFSYMDSMISQLNSQYSGFLSTIGNKSS